MMRISSSDTNGTKGVCFCSAVFEKLPCKLDPILTPEADDGQSGHFFHFVNTRFNGQMLVFQNPQFMLSIPIYIFYGVLRSPGGQF